MNSYVTILLIIALIALFIWMKWDEKRKWETIYEAFGDKLNEVQMRYNLLKRQGIRCRLKNYTPGTVRMVGMQGGQMSKQSTIQLQVNKKDIDQAYKHLADFMK